MSELFDKGLKVRKEVLGEDYVNKSIAGADEFTRTMAEWSTEFCWGALWTTAARNGPPDPQYCQSGDAGRAEPASRAETARQGRAEERRHQGRDQGDPVAGGGVLRRARRYRCLPQRARSAQRSRIRSSEGREQEVAWPSRNTNSLPSAMRPARRGAAIISSAATRTTGRCRWTTSCGWRKEEGALRHRHRLQCGSIEEAEPDVPALSD